MPRVDSWTKARRGVFWGSSRWGSGGGRSRPPTRPPSSRSRPPAPKMFSIHGSSRTSLRRSTPSTLWSAAAAAGVLRGLRELGLGPRRLPPYGLQAFVQRSPRGIKDVLDQWFESDELKAFYCSQAVIGAYGGIHEPGTAFLLLHDVLGGVDGSVGVWGVVVGGMGMITKALAAAARERGAYVRGHGPVQRIQPDEAGPAEGGSPA